VWGGTFACLLFTLVLRESFSNGPGGGLTRGRADIEEWQGAKPSKRSTEEAMRYTF